MKQLFWGVALSMSLAGTAVAQDNPVIDIGGGKRIQPILFDVGSSGGAEIHKTIPLKGRINPATAVVSVTTQQRETTNYPDMWVTKIDEITPTSIRVKVRRIDAGAGWAANLRLHVLVID